MNRCVIVLSVLCFITISFAQAPDTIWTKTYGGVNVDRGYSVKQTSDGGFIIGGESTSFGDDHGYLIKTDANGDTLWTRMYYDHIRTILQTFDGGYIFTGGYRGLGWHMNIVRTDSLGDTLWTRKYTLGDYSTQAEEIQPTSDSCYIIVGTAIDTIYPWEFFFNIFLAKIDDDGNTRWTKEYGYLGEQGFSAQQTYDGGYIVAGWWMGLSCLMKTDSLGDTLWTKLYDGGGGVRSVRQTADGGYIFAGRIGSPDDVYVVKTDSFGDTLWTRAYGGTNNDESKCIRETPDGCYIITGQTTSYGAGGWDVYLLKISNMGDSLWASAYGGTGYDIGYEVEITSDSGYIITGITDSYGAGGHDVYLLRIAPDTLGIKEQKITVITDDNFGMTVISGPLPLLEGRNCRVFDITGRVVMPDKIKPGIYFIEVDGVITHKVIKIK